MRTLDLLKLSTRMFRTRLLRTSLTILGVSVGIGTIVFLVSLGYGLQTILLEQITTSESLLSLDVFPPDTDLGIITPSNLEEFKNIGHVKEVVPISIYPVQITAEKATTDATGNITTSAYFRLSGLAPQTGLLFEEGAREGIVISATVAELFEWKLEEAIGKKVSITVFYPDRNERGERKARDIEERRTDVVIEGVVQGETPVVFVSPNIFSQAVFTEYAQVKVRVESGDFLEAVRGELFDKGYSVSALSDVVEQANKIFKALQVILAVFGTAALLVSAIGMFNTMTIAFLERTQEIGIMRALGASSTDIFLLFLVESGLMGFLGGFCGVLIGYAAQWSVNVGVQLLAASLGGRAVDLFRTPLWFVLLIIAFSTMVGFITGIIPGRRASRLNPLSALMYK